MTTTKILAAAAAACSIILVAASASFRDARHASPQPSTRGESTKADFDKDDFDARFALSRKGDRLPSSASLPLAAASAPSEAPPPVASPPEQLQLATDDDLRQAEAEHHRQRDICRHGRTWFTIEKHQYWRCKP
ncbi:MAG TPA: hypothetical protein VID30_18850 [Bradyrhizobium sp.]|jgi:hypothetical protein